MDNFFKVVKDLFDRILNSLAGLGEISEVYTLLVRWILPVLAVTIFIRCILPLIWTEKQNKTWAYLGMPDGTRIPLNHWENSIGRSKGSDVVINLSFISRSHAVLTLSGNVWTITDLGSKGGVEVNGEKIEGSGTVKEGDTISFAGVEMTLLPSESALAGADRKNSKENPAGKNFGSGMTFLLILLFQILGGVQSCFSMGGEPDAAVPMTFLAFLFIECFYYLIMRLISRKYFELELLCFFLCGMNLLVVASADHGSLYKQLLSILLGMAVYTMLGWLIKDLGRACMIRNVLTALALVLLAFNLVFGETRFGARNWINLGFLTFQPFEFIKVAFVLAGAATLDRLLTARNLTAFIGFSGACIGGLVLIRDFGTAVIFFGTFLVIAFMRSGDIRTIALISAGAVLGAVTVISFMPYIASRFASWRHAWEYVGTTGYQQVNTMIAAASGGLLGVGGGNGYLVDIAAADTDLVFGVICEEWGLVVAFTTVSIIMFFGVFAVTKRCRSSFYAIAACGAATVFLIQVSLNVFGSLDILPLTGVTMPFVSNGGSSMIASWGLMAFIKAADDRERPRRAAVKADIHAAVKPGIHAKYNEDTAADIDTAVKTDNAGGWNK